MPQKIFFDLSCFKEEFQEFIYKSVNVSNYFEFINKFQNQHSLILSNILLTEEDCSFKDITTNTTITKMVEDSIDFTSDDYEILYPYVIENKNIIIKNNTSIPKKMNKLFMKNGGKLNNNNWVFPLSNLQFVKNLNANMCIKEIRNEEKRTIIFPTNKHPKLGVSVIYDKKGNIGIWDNIIKGWIFQK